MFFKPSNMMIGVTGPYTIDELKTVLQKYMGSMKGNAMIPSYPVVKSSAHKFKVYFAEKENQTQSQIAVGHLGYRENIVNHPVEHQTGREEGKENRESKGQSHHNLSLHRVNGGRVKLLLDKHGDTHDHRQNKEWILN